MQVLKFGGTSVADASSIQQVIKIIADAGARDKTIVVASALSGVTNTLTKQAVWPPWEIRRIWS